MKRLMLSLVLVAGLVAGCGSGGGVEEPVRVAYFAGTLSAPLFIADAKGYFIDEGISVEMQAVKSGQDAIPLAASRQLDVVAAGFSAGLFSAVHSGLPIKVVGSLATADGRMDNATAGLLVRKDLSSSGAVKSLADLRGRRVAVSGGPGSAGGYIADRILRDAGLTLRDIEPINISNPDMPTALGSGSVDAVLTNSPFSGIIERNGTGVLMAVPPKGDASTGLIFGAHFVGDQRAPRFFAALARAAQDLQGDGAKSEENLAIIARATSQSADTLRGLPSYIYLPNLAPSSDSLAAMQRSYLEAGLLQYDEPMDVATFVDERFAAQNIPGR